jgi:hypothetical protein
VKPWCALVLASTLTARSHAISAEDEARALIGRLYVAPAQGATLAEPLSCTDLGSGVLSLNGRLRKDWISAEALCQGRPVVLLIHGSQARKSWRVVDAIALPAARVAQPYVKDPEALWLFTPEECLLDGKGGNDFVAVVRWTDEQRIDARHGLVQAWGYDLKKAKIVPLALTRVRCWHPEED